MGALNRVLMVGLVSLAGCSGGEAGKTASPPSAVQSEPEKPGPLDSALEPGTKALVVATEHEGDTVAGSRTKDGSVFVLLAGPGGGGNLPEGTRTVVLEDQDPRSEAGGNRAVKIRVDEGKWEGRTGNIARFCLAPEKAPR